MFDDGGGDVHTPQVRFSGFNDEWVEKKLGEVSTVVRGSSPRPIHDAKWFDKTSDVGWLKISDVTSQNGQIKHLSLHLSELGQEKTRVLIEPHLLLSIAATVGSPVMTYVKTGVHDGFVIFEDSRFEKEFMFYRLELFKPSWKRYGQPGSQVNLNIDLVKNQKFNVPSLPEQQKIGQLFKKLDARISNEQTKIEQLKAQKQGLLQRML